ncbi:MAG: hypothetical protein JRF33_15425 [Deltaproteobacteria bacterium]|nr:hypothetical protein [Deltaproteobacteria bacterium]
MTAFIRATYASLILAGLFLACTPANDGQLVLKIYMPESAHADLRTNPPNTDGSAPSDITDYRICVYAEDMGSRKCENFNVADHPGGAKLGGLKPGEDRRVTFRGYDNESKDVRWAGQVTGVTVAAEATTPISMFISVASDFTEVGNEMSTRRVFHTATLLDDGRVMLVGGFSDMNHNVLDDHHTLTATSAIEIYNPRTGQFDPPGGLSLNRPRALHTATKLDDGKVLIVGGVSSARWMVGFPGGIAPVLNLSGSAGDLAASTAELIDPSRASVQDLDLTPTPGRAMHQALRYSGGEVALLGGVNPETNTSMREISIFDGVGFYTSDVELATGREGMASVPFGRNTNLIFGGNHALGTSSGPYAEVIVDQDGDDPFSRILNLGTEGDPVFYSTGAALDDRTVLICGGMIVDDSYRPGQIQPEIKNKFYIVDLTANQESITAPTAGMVFQRAFHTATGITNEAGEVSEVVVTGGVTRFDVTINQWIPTNVVEFFNPETFEFDRREINNSRVEFNLARAGHRATPLDDGCILFTGGFTDDQSGLGISASAELYNPASRDLE